MLQFESEILHPVVRLVKADGLAAAHDSVSVRRIIEIFGQFVLDIPPGEQRDRIEEIWLHHSRDAIGGS